MQGDAIRDFNITSNGNNINMWSEYNSQNNFGLGGSYNGRTPIFGKVSLSNSNVPTTDPVTGENRPYNFNTSLAIKI